MWINDAINWKWLIVYTVIFLLNIYTLLTKRITFYYLLFVLYLERNLKIDIDMYVLIVDTHTHTHTSKSVY